MGRLVYLIPSICVVIVALLIAYSPISPVSYNHLQTAPKLSGVLAPNNVLTTASVKRHFEGRLLGPESFAKHPWTGDVYTGTADGKIWRIDPRTMSLSEILRTGTDDEQCGKLQRMEPICGRPMGMKFDSQGRLIVADAYFGILSIDVENKVGEILVEAWSSWRFFNGLDIAADGTIYFSLSSRKWHLYDYLLAVIEMKNDGIIFAYNPITKEVTTVVDNLYMPTGIRLSENDESILISEITISRISRYSLKGPNSRKYSVVIDNLPAYIDNIQATSQGTFYLCPIVSRFSPNQTVWGVNIPPLLDSLAEFPNVKRLMAVVTPYWAYEYFLPKATYFLEMDADGNILRSFHDFKGINLKGIGDVIEVDDKLFFGSVETRYLGVAYKRDVL